MVKIGKKAKYLTAVSCAFILIFIFIYPREVMLSAKAGLLLWYNSVLPSIFPFLITSGILIEIGVVRKLGRYLEPVMRPLFNVPGSGAFALVMGSLSGYPLGAKIVADLREKNAVTKEEAQRLISFCNNSGPLFVVGAVGTAILGSVRAGYFILITGYIASLIVGLLFRFYKSGERHNSRVSAQKYVLSQTQPQPFGKILGGVVSRSVETVLQIGGFMLLFSVLISILERSGLLSMCANILCVFFVPENLALPVTKGIIEITNGAKAVADTAVHINQKVIVTSMIISFSGLSIFAQTVSFISKTDISAKVYAFSKILQAAVHGLIAAACLSLIRL